MFYFFISNALQDQNKYVYISAHMFKFSELKIGWTTAWKTIYKLHAFKTVQLLVSYARVVQVLFYHIHTTYQSWILRKKSVSNVKIVLFN